MTTALERNERYLREFVEALQLCPFARRCRESGKLHRRVVARGESLLEHVRAVESLPEGSVEVALLICPHATEGPREWEQVAQTLRAALGPSPRFFCVAFHPELPRDLADANRAVRFIRRSPDPTIQLVNAEVLLAVRRGREGGSTFLDTSLLTTAELLAVAGAKSLSEAIADANLATIEREGAERLEALLASFRS